jgi:acyl carrier protein
MNILELLKVVKRVFPEERAIEAHMTKKEIISWDSIGHLNLIIEIEDEFGLTLSMEEIESIDSIKKLFDIVKNKSTSYGKSR